jgi:hypothetical protein
MMMRSSGTVGDADNDIAEDTAADTAAEETGAEETSDTAAGPSIGDDTAVTADTAAEDTADTATEDAAPLATTAPLLAAAPVPADTAVCTAKAKLAMARFSEIYNLLPPVPSQFPLMENINQEIQQGFSLIKKIPYEFLAPPCGTTAHVGVKV